MRQTSFLDQLRAAASGQGARSLRAQKAADVIRRRRAYRWVGIYEVGREDVALVAWSGFGDHPDDAPIPIDGLHGTTLRAGTSEVARSGSKIVVPIMDNGEVIGLFDVEDDLRPALSGSDRSLLEGCASVLATLWADKKPPSAASSTAGNHGSQPSHGGQEPAKG